VNTLQAMTRPRQTRSTSTNTPFKSSRSYQPFSRVRLANEFVTEDHW